MTIHKAKASDYSSVNAEGMTRYIQEYAQTINDYVNGICGDGEKLVEKNKTQLKAIAAELETVKKRLDFILYGKY